MALTTIVRAQRATESLDDEESMWCQLEDAPTCFLALLSMATFEEGWEGFVSYEWSLFDAWYMIYYSIFSGLCTYSKSFVKTIKKMKIFQCLAIGYLYFLGLEIRPKYFV